MTTFVTVRPGVEFRADAAASFVRLEAEVGMIRCNSTRRDRDLQARMHAASVAYENGTGPYPGHSYAVAPDDSQHVLGLAFDADRAKIIRAQARDHGWFHVTRAGEEHHLEYRPAYDNHRNDPAPAGEEEDDMFTQEDRARMVNIERLLSGQQNATNDGKVGILHTAKSASDNAAKAFAAVNNVEEIVSDIRNIITDPEAGVLGKLDALS